MKEKNKNLTFSIHKFSIKEENDKSFLRIKFWAISEGVNRNNVDFLLEGIAKAMPTVRNKPVLGAFDKTANKFKGHEDLGIVEEDGEIFVDYDSGFLDGIAEKAIGVIPSESNVQIEEYEGKNWLTFDALIWTKYSHRAVKLLEKLGAEKISVEITIIDGETTDDGILVIKEFMLDGVTVIGVPEGIEGAHLKVGQFAKSQEFNKYSQALAFAYEDKKKKGNDEIDMKFDFKGMGINDFSSKMRSVLKDYTYTIEGDDYEYRKYWVYDIFPDDNFVILEDCENYRLVQVPFVITDEREIALDFNNAAEVEVEYVETTYKKKVEFAKHLVEKSAADDINIEKGGSKMDLKFLDKFVEKDYTPICKLDKFVLFTKKDEDGKVYKLEFETIDKGEEEKFEEILVQMTLAELKGDVLEGMEIVSRVEFEKIEIELKETKKSLETEKQKFSEELESKKLECTNLEKELSETKEKCAKFELEKFKVEAEQFIKENAEEFGEGKDKFIKESFDKIESGELTDMVSTKRFVSDQLLESRIKEREKQKVEFNLNPELKNVNKDESTKGSALGRL